MPAGVTTYVATFIDNHGDADIILSGAEITGVDTADFRLIELPGSVKPRDIDYPNSSKRILVSFTPSSPGYKTAVLSFRTNEERSYTIPLSGTGIASPTPEDKAVSTWAYKYKTRPSRSVGDLVTQMHEAPDGGIFLI